MKLRYTVATTCVVALIAAPAAMAKSFSGTVSGGGISASYSIKAKGKKVCVSYRGSSSSNEPEEVRFSVAGGGSFNDSRPRDDKYCKTDKGFAKALKKASQVSAKGQGAYGEKIKGTLT
ncbi:MAG: hypothetical protein QOG62_2384 [Thermoleophilaceae bacterium]|jgi:hypothetical protein|nr:hypothetical protein [Thermoleophilaceae bacterium]